MERIGRRCPALWCLSSVHVVTTPMLFLMGRVADPLVSLLKRVVKASLPLDGEDSAQSVKVRGSQEARGRS